MDGDGAGCGRRRNGCFACTTGRRFFCSYITCSIKHIASRCLPFLHPLISPSVILFCSELFSFSSTTTTHTAGFPTPCQCCAFRLHTRTHTRPLFLHFSPPHTTHTHRKGPSLPPPPPCHALLPLPSAAYIHNPISVSYSVLSTTCRHSALHLPCIPCCLQYLLCSVVW